MSDSKIWQSTFKRNKKSKIRFDGWCWDEGGNDELTNALSKMLAARLDVVFSKDGASIFAKIDPIKSSDMEISVDIEIEEYEAAATCKFQLHELLAFCVIDRPEMGRKVAKILRSLADKCENDLSKNI